MREREAGPEGAKRNEAPQRAGLSFPSLMMGNDFARMRILTIHRHKRQCRFALFANHEGSREHNEMMGDHDEQ